MPMGVLTNDDFESELDLYIQRPKVEIIEQKIGRGNTNEVPESLRKIISEEAINGTPSKELAQIFDVSPATISAYKNDATSTASYNRPDDKLKQHNDNIRNVITGKAKSKIIKALDSITDDKLHEAPIVILASVARNMSAIIKDIEPEEKKDEVVRPQFVVFAPQFKDERAFEVIQVKE